MKHGIGFRWFCIFLVSLLTVIMTSPSNSVVTWQSPPSPINEILDAPLPPAIIISPNYQWFVELERTYLIPIAELAEPELPLAGLRINPQTNAPASYNVYRNLTYKPLAGGESRSLDLPEDSRLSFFRWSSTGDRLAFTITQTTGLELWVLDLPSGKLQRLTEPILNATYGNPCRWLPNGEELICKVIDGNREAPPEAPVVPDGPTVEENLGRKAPARTYTNLLKNPHDEALLEYYLTSSLVKIDLNGNQTTIVTPALIDEAIASPDGNYLLLITRHRPFSYQLPISRFPKKTEVLDSNGKLVYEVADLPLADDIPIKFGSTRKGRRNVSWRSDKPATLYWTEALDGGDAGAEAEERDAIFQLNAPFTNQPQEIWRTQYRFDGIAWGKEDTALAWEWWFDNRLQRMWRINPDNPEAEPQLLLERNYQDQYSSPGEPVSKIGKYGRSVLRFSPDGNSVYFRGRGASPTGVYPFLDQRDITSNETERLWQAQDPYYEQVVSVLNDAASSLITRRQSQQDAPNYFFYPNREDNNSVQLTNYQDPAPPLANVQKELIQYEREDGVKLSATLYLPPGYNQERDGALPAVFWVYPQEFKDAATAGQITTAENGFSRPFGSSVLFMLLQGYAVVNNPTMPIIGEGDMEPNDTYVEQLLMGAKAAVDAVVSRGVADPDRLVIGGQSYGAFTTANLLAHSDLFRAGIAMSGAYNRSLTPFGFQGEQRNFWEATSTYMKVSPFTNADKITEPLLLIHGADDNNSGTYPIQSERLYEAMKGLGGTVRWVELPYEGHGYRGRESVGHVLWEMIQWCDRYAKSH